MSIYEIVSVTISAFAFLVSIYSFLRSKALNEATVELQMEESINSTQVRVEDISQQLAILLEEGVSDADKRLGVLKRALKSAMERYVNSLDSACGKYIDKKVDRKRFKKTYRTVIRRLVEDEDHKEFFDPTTSKYREILKVYGEWEYSEKK
jgi:chemotaxis regulatin CheY-phosphate phosphatase CheZ